MAGDAKGRQPRRPDLSDLPLRLRSEVGRIDERLRTLLSTMDRLEGLLDVVRAIW